MSPWITPAMAARAFARSEATIRTWMRAGDVRSMCILRTKMVVVFWPDVANVDAQRKRRVRERRSVLK